MRRCRVPGYAGLTLWILAVTAWATWAPFKLAPVAKRPEWIPVLDMEAVIHLFLLVPLAVVFLARQEGTGGIFSVTRILVLTGGVALILEAGQMWIDERSPAVYEPFLSVAGVAMTILAFPYLQRRNISSKIVLNSLLGAMLLILVIGTGFALYVQGNELSLKGWEPEFEVALADEVGGGRSYQGKVLEARLCAGNNEEVCIEPGMDQTAKEHFVTTALESQSIQVSAVVESHSDEQVGPARIITFSCSPLERNLTLGQAGRDLVLRVRTPMSGPNATEAVYVLPEAVPDFQQTSLLAVYNRGVVQMESRGAGWSRQGEFRPDFLRTSVEIDGWGYKQRLPYLLRNRAGLVALLLTFSGVGLLVGLASRRSTLKTALLTSVSSIAVLFLIETLVLRTNIPGLYECSLVVAATGVGALLARYSET